MARLLSLKYEDDVYHVTACGNGRQAIHRDAQIGIDCSIFWGVKWSKNNGAATPTAYWTIRIIPARKAPSRSRTGQNLAPMQS
jgi:hypothetical protein